MSFTKPYSEKTAERIDAEVQKLIAEQYERAKTILRDHSEQHAALTQMLIDREVIFREDVETIFGARPWKSRADELLEIQEAEKRKKAEAMAEAHFAKKAAEAAEAALNEGESPESPTANAPSDSPSGTSESEEAINNKPTEP